VKTHRGFSMIEVVVTIAIFGILLATAAPGIGDWIRNAKIRNTAESIQNGLQLARNAAMGRNRPVSLYLVSDLTNSCTLSNTSGTWVVSVSSPVGKCAASPSLTVAPQIVAKGAASDGGSATVLATTQPNISTAATTTTFNGLGMLAQTSASTAARAFQVSSAGGTSYVRRVEVSFGGVSRLCDPAITTDGDARKCTQP